jgi:peptide/nickel transport system substrate-binding protein
MQRRAFLASGTAALLSAPALGQDRRANTLRLVPQVNLNVLDPIMSGAGATMNHGYAVFDTLYGTGEDLRPKPQMAEGHTVSDDGRTWVIRLRDGLRFHDGEPVRGIDCALSLQRWARRNTFGQALTPFLEGFDAPDDRTVRVRLKQPFPQLLAAIGHVGPMAAFIMPERIAKTDPFTAVTEIVGSGPYRFLPGEYVSGSRVGYAKFDGYRPRSEAPFLNSGGKVAHFERIEWNVIPDSSTAAAALQSGSADWWEYVDPDLTPILARRRDIRMQAYDPRGFIAFMRFNHLQPPFNNVKLRRVVLEAVQQSDYMTLISGGNPQFWRSCYAMFPAGQPMVRDLGESIMGGPKDLDRLRRAVRESGYAGERVVILNPGDFPLLNPHGEVTADLLRKLGLNVDLQTMDWGTVIQRNLSREPVERGGWSIFHTFWKSIQIANPALNTAIRGNAAFSGWYSNEDNIRLTQSWLETPDEAEQQRLMDEIQRVAFDTVPSVPLGIFMPQTAFRSDITGVLSGPFVFPWNLRRA